MDVTKVLALIRRYADMMATKKIKANRVKHMTDAELASYDEDLSGEWKTIQEEAERLEREGRNTEPQPK